MRFLPHPSQQFFLPSDWVPAWSSCLRATRSESLVKVYTYPKEWAEASNKTLPWSDNGLYFHGSTLRRDKLGPLCTLVGFSIQRWGGGMKVPLDFFICSTSRSLFPAPLYCLMVSISALLFGWLPGTSMIDCAARFYSSFRSSLSESYLLIRYTAAVQFRMNWCLSSSSTCLREYNNVWQRRKTCRIPLLDVFVLLRGL